MVVGGGTVPYLSIIERPYKLYCHVSAVRKTTMARSGSSLRLITHPTTPPSPTIIYIHSIQNQQFIFSPNEKKQNNLFFPKKNPPPGRKEGGGKNIIKNIGKIHASFLLYYTADRMPRPIGEVWSRILPPRTRFDLHYSSIEG